MNNYITNRQIGFLLLLTLTSYGVVDIARSLAASAGLGSWLTLIIASLFFAFVAIIIVSLNYRFCGDMLCDYSKKLVGKFLSFIIVLFYLIYFLLIVVFLNIELAFVLEAEFIPKTPRAATILFGIPVFCFIAYKGVITVARLAEYFGLIYLIVFVSIHLVMFTQGDVMQIRPLFNPNEAHLYFEALSKAIFPFLGIEVLLFIPLSYKNGKKVKLTAFLSLIGIGLFYILVVESCIVKLGLDEIVHYNDSIIVAIRDMELSFLNFLKRLDILFLTIGFAGFFTGISVVYTTILEILSKMIPKAKRSILIIIVGVVTYTISFLLLKSQEFPKFVLNIGKYLGLVSAFIIPIILLIISKVKKYV